MHRRPAIWIAAVFAALFGAPLAAQTISEQALRSHIAVLSSDAFEGRAPGTAGEEKPGEAEEPAHARGDVSASARIGRAGGTLELSSGVKIEIPAGAISEPIDLSLSYGGATSAFANREDERPLGRVFVVAP